MQIFGIIGRYNNEFRLSVKATEAMNQGWLKILNNEMEGEYNSFEEAIKEPYQCYLSNDEGYLVMEVIRDIEEHTYHTEYYFDDYEYIDAELSDEELAEIDEFIQQYKDKIPDQEELEIYTEEDFIKRLPKELPWVSNL